jgi:hypothetical protein
LARPSRGILGHLFPWLKVTVNEYIDYLCDLIAAEPDNERQLMLVKLLEFQLSQTTLQMQNRVTQFLRKIPKDIRAA